MLTKFKYIAVTAWGVLAATFSMAQDFHLSQFTANHHYLNPALTGLRENNEDYSYRINTHYREQGGKYLDGYNLTIGAGFDKPLNKKFSIGEYVINNKAIKGSFNTFNLMVSGSYNITGKENVNDEQRHHDMSVGLQLGLLQKSLNGGDFDYDSQYSPLAPGGFDKSLSSGESFTQQSFFRFDANIGVYYRFNSPSKNYSPFGGFSIYHLTQPEESFINDISKIPMRFNLHGGCHYKVNERFRILPQVLYMTQAKAREINVEVICFNKLEGSDYEPMLGLAWRNKDAIVIHLGLKQKKCFFRVSYDVNAFSYLKKYMNGKSGLELSLIYTGYKKDSFKVPEASF